MNIVSDRLMFFKELDLKTNWGRNQLKDVFGYIFIDNNKLYPALKQRFYLELEIRTCHGLNKVKQLFDDILIQKMEMLINGRL